jgi:hypothetical protein
MDILIHVLSGFLEIFLGKATEPWRPDTALFPRRNQASSELGK